MSEFLDYVLEQLNPLQPIVVKRMFGSCGLFRHNLMFALIDNEQLYIKADEKSKALFLAEGGHTFYYFIKRNERRQRIDLGYYSIPESALDNSDEMLYWVRLGIEASLRKR